MDPRAILDLRVKRVIRDLPGQPDLPASLY
jgi:hypothetical protein